MAGKFITGALIGAAVSVLLTPELDRGTRRKIKRTSRFMRGAAEEIYGSVRRIW